MAAVKCTAAYTLLSACLLFLGTRVAPLTAINPCESSDGSGVVQLELNFTESYGGGDHLVPILGEERSLGQIYGTVRNVNDTRAVGANTVVLRLWDVKYENKFCNKSQFSPLEKFFASISARSGVAYVKLKRGIDRERLNIYVAETPGVTLAGASIMFHVECTPDDPTFSARNFSVRALINDLDDTSPAFYNATARTGGIGSLANCQQVASLEQGNFTVIVRQNTPRGVLVFSGAVARDRDEGLNAQTRVTLQKNPYFEVADDQQQADSSELRIRTKRQVYYDSFDKPGGVTLRLLAFAEDSPANASQRLSSTATIAFNIVAEEDLPPKFVVPGCRLFKSLCVNPAYSATVSSGINTTGPLSIAPGPILAVNRDSLESSIHYSLLAADDDHQSSFWIDRDTGQVTQLRPIDRQVVLVVKATKWTEQSPYLLSDHYCVALLVVSVDDISNSSTIVIASTEDSGAVVTTAAPPIRRSTLALMSALIAVCGVQTFVIATLLLRCLVASRKQKPPVKPDQIPDKANDMDQNHTAENRHSQSSPTTTRDQSPPDDHGDNNPDCATPTFQRNVPSITNDLETSGDNSKHRAFVQLQNSIVDNEEDNDMCEVLMTTRAEADKLTS